MLVNDDLLILLISSKFELGKGTNRHKIEILGRVNKN